MKRSTLLLSAITLLLLALGGIMFQQIQKEEEMVQQELSPSMAPEAQAARLTSHLLIRKIEQVRNTAVFLQHREEGRKLLELGMPEEEGEESEEMEE